MTKTKSKRKTASSASDSKTKTRNSVRRTTARKTVQLKSVTKPPAHQQPQSAPADRTARKQKGSHHCNVANARWRDHRGDGTGSEMATPFGPRLSRRCRTQEAWLHSCLSRWREWARLPDYGSHGVRGGVARCGKHLARYCSAWRVLAENASRLPAPSKGAAALIHAHHPISDVR